MPANPPYASRSSRLDAGPHTSHVEAVPGLPFKILLVLCLGGVFAVLLPWMAWRRLLSLRRAHGGALLVRGVSGAQAARIVLLRGEVPQVDVDETSLTVNDFYSAHEPAVKLSPETYHGRTLFDVARAARLAGHALQHRDRKLGGLSAWDSFMILWGNAWPVLFVLLALGGRGRILWACAGFGVLAMVLAFAHLLKHAHVKDAARRGRAELESAKLLDGHPPEEVEAAFTAACMEHLALPYSRTWWKLLLFR